MRHGGGREGGSEGGREVGREGEREEGEGGWGVGVCVRASTVYGLVHMHV